MSIGSARRRQHSTSIGLGKPLGPSQFVGQGGPAFRRSWEIWSLKRGVLAYLLAAEAAAVGLTAVMLVHQRIGPWSLLMLGVIVVMGLLKEEATRRVERMRRRYSDTPHQNMTSVWTLAAAFVLPPGLAFVVVAVLYAYLWRRIWAPAGATRPWKVVFSASTVTLACHSATGVRYAFGTQPAVTGLALIMAMVAILVYSIVNLGLVAGAIALMTSERSARRLFGTPGDAALEYATLAIGAVAAEQLHQGSWLVLALMVPLLVLHDNVLVRELQEAVSTDPKTGLLNTTAWHAQALAELERAKREQEQVGVLMIDLDHFKAVNEECGHLIADEVLAAVVEQFKHDTRPYDLLGRFGGDEFLMLCPGVDAAELLGIAERVRTAVEHLEIAHGERGVRVTVSIGAAVFPDVGSELDDLLLAADTALFAAKDGERNRVVVHQRSTGGSAQGSSDNSSAMARARATASPLSMAHFATGRSERSSVSPRGDSS